MVFELIPIKNLMSNQVYQRPLSEGHIISAVKDFDVYQINPVKVSRRNGINYVFDGQHTIEIVASRSGSRDTPVWCIGTLSITHISYNHKVSHIAQLLIFSVTAMIPLLAVLTWVVFRLNGLSKRRILLNSWGRNMYGFHKDMVTIQSTMEPKKEGEPLRPLRGHLP